MCAILTQTTSHTCSGNTCSVLQWPLIKAETQVLFKVYLSRFVYCLSLWHSVVALDFNV